MENLQQMSPALLLENFRSLARGQGATSDPKESKRLSDKADLYEQEISRRMAW